uniref:Uncharacterized protein n=1 Tax=Cacopsylla melanoneura TaxID=428564 RepID=A0A8D8PLX0_9HEMI
MFLGNINIDLEKMIWKIDLMVVYFFPQIKKIISNAHYLEPRYRNNYLRNLMLIETKRWSTCTIIVHYSVHILFGNEIDCEQRGFYNVQKGVSLFFRTNFPDKKTSCI